MKLERARIVEEALALLQAEGLDGLTTRKLADRLQVKQPALYWHFADKRALLDALNAAILAPARRAPAPGEDWRAFLRDHARAFRRALLAYRDGARVHAGSRAGAPDREAAEAHLAFLVAAGFAPKDALLALVALSRYVVGAVLEEQAEAAHPPAPGDGVGLPQLEAALATYLALGPDEAFEHGLAALLAGLRP